MLGVYAFRRAGCRGVDSHCVREVVPQCVDRRLVLRIASGAGEGDFALIEAGCR